MQGGLSVIDKIISRYRSLPPLSLMDKVAFAILRSLYKKLNRRGIIDVDCSLLMSRYPKAPYSHSANHFERIICLGGFGWSGSGAVLDLLKEYDNVTVSFPIAGSNECRFCPEFDLIRCAGGLFDLERAFETTNIYIRDAAIRLFLSQIKYLYINEKSLYGGEFLQQTKRFLERLISFKAPSCGIYGFCPNYAGLGRLGEKLIWSEQGDSNASNYVYYLKNLSIYEYRQIAQEYLLDIFKSLPTEKFLVLDQAVSDYSGNMERYEDYLGKIKLINVYRDPRDVLAMKLLHPDIDWIPENGEDFVRWYRDNHMPSMMVNHPDFMMMRFEDVVCRYDESVEAIEKFCGLIPEWHVRPRTKFNPDISIRNIGIYKQFEDNANMQLVRRELSDFIV